MSARRLRSRLSSRKLLFLAFWYGQTGLVFIILGFETKGRSIEEIDRSLKTPAVGGLASV